MVQGHHGCPDPSKGAARDRGCSRTRGQIPRDLSQDAYGRIPRKLDNKRLIEGIYSTSAGPRARQRHETRPAPQPHEPLPVPCGCRDRPRSSAGRSLGPAACVADSGSHGAGPRDDTVGRGGPLAVRGEQQYRSPVPGGSSCPATTFMPRGRCSRWTTQVDMGGCEMHNQSANLVSYHSFRDLPQRRHPEAGHAASFYPARTWQAEGSIAGRAESTIRTPAVFRPRSMNVTFWTDQQRGGCDEECRCGRCAGTT